MNNIIISNTNKQKLANNAYNEIGFIAQSLIPKIDTLKETNKPKHQLKKAVNDLLSELEKVTKEHRANFEHYGKIEAKDGNHDALDIYYVTAKAYDELLDLPANDITSLMALNRRLKAEGVDYKEVLIDYIPILK
ncbi:hypothetical protein I4P13_15510 [Elizabethkingia meningoseptica]|uniref:hypothetical protein n=1 Tax=Elizabethkingia meningoseptica TaxID=238 RepID=UPI001625CE37|nr:hypothetical protein [Elizabethkingia meningoseptica]MBG0512908.1 hypothetical protein [Elizabethkingia meningoseptica]MBG0515175.1 hypothetical protein [Elizabethkingia meningoseptica]